MGQSSERKSRKCQKHLFKVVSLLKLNKFSVLFAEEAYRSGRCFLAFYLGKAHFSSL